jgi:hypothetical protein
VTTPKASPVSSVPILTASTNTSGRSAANPSISAPLAPRNGPSCSRST